MSALRKKQTGNVTLRLSAPVEIQLSDEGQEGPAQFSALAYSGDVVPGYTAGLKDPLVLDLAGMKTARNVVANLDHEKKHRVGHVTDISNNGSEVTVDGVLSAATPHRDEVAESAKNGFGWEVSIEAQLGTRKKLPAKKTTEVNGRTIVGPAWIVREANLTGIAFVSNGADQGNSVTIAASADEEKPMSKVAEFAASLGVDWDDASDEVKQRLEALMEAQKKPSTPQSNSVDAFEEFTAKQLEATQREQQIGVMTAKLMNEYKADAAEVQKLGRQALEQGWTCDQLELAVRREARPAASMFAARTKPERSTKLMECALAMTSGIDAEKAYGGELCQQVEDAGLRGFGLQQAVMEAAAQNGAPVRAGERITAGNIRNVFRSAFNPMPEVRMGGEWSTIDLPGILGNVANKSLLQGYMESDSTWREISEVRSVSNFHIHTHYRMLDDLEYELVGKGGLIPHGELGEESYTSQAHTYGKMLGLTRQDIINDDLSAFSRIRDRLGMGAAKKFNDLVWTKFMDNASHYTLGRGNYIEGATTNLGLDGVGLEQGITAFRQLKSPDADGNKRVGMTGAGPTGLLVPPELEFISLRLYQSMGIQSGTTNDPGNPDANIHAGKYSPIVQPRLSDSTFTGNSTTAWYLLSDMLKPIVVTFLNGQQTPTIESADADFNTLGVLFRGYHDFGADLAEYLGSIKSKGAA